MAVPKRIGVVTYLFNALAGILSWILFWGFNRTKVIGKENIIHGKNILIVSNHLTLIDSILVASAYCFPKVILYPSLAPYHTPDAENYLKAKLLAGKSKFLARLLTPLTTFLFVNLKCIPVGNNRRDVEALRNVKRVLPEGSVHLFPEGTRSRTGKLGEAKDGIGYIIYGIWPQILPINIRGIEKVLPIKAKFPRIGKRITLTIGKPFDCHEFIGAPNDRQTWKTITRKVMDKIAILAPSET